MSKTRSITEAQRQPATYADVLAVINTASTMIAALEARIVALEEVNANRITHAWHESEKAAEAKPE